MRNPNGYGTVVKLSGKRRNPFAIRKTKGFNEKGWPIYICVGYAKTREEGMMLLAQYNKTPWDIEADKTTLGDLFKLWKEKRMVKLGASNAASLCCAYNYCQQYEDLKYNQIKSYQMQDSIDTCGCGYSTQAAIKNLWGHLDRFAQELDIINKRNSELLTSEPVPESKKLPFTDEEVQRVWDNQQLSWADSILFFLYTGFRISEMLSLETADVNFEDGTMKGGTKTAAGKNRLVPIHSKILPIVQKRFNEGNKYLFSYQGKKCSQTQYRIFWKDLLDKLQMEHTPHECRHTFRSRMDSAGANKVCIDLIMGHKSLDVGERVYTHKTISELKQAIELITN